MRPSAARRSGLPRRRERLGGASRLFAALLLVAGPASLAGQATGRILGEVVDAETGDPVAGAQASVVGHPLRTISNRVGRFVLTAVPPGDRTLTVEMLGYRSTTVEHVRVRAGHPVEVAVRLTPVPVDVPGLVVEAERVRLMEPEVTASHEVVLGRELRELPVDRVAEAIELTPGVSDGHFRGGRVGQETYVVDGFALKNQLEGSTQGSVLELSPTSLEEIEVVTGGFGAEFGSALSGVVSLVTRRGDPQEWRRRASVRTDHWAPHPLFRGFSELSMSAGGPVRLLGAGSTLFVDVLAQALADADPRSRGTTCVRADDASAELAARIDQLRDIAPSLYCPYERSTLPGQQGDKLIGFARFDRPLGAGLTFTGSLLYNRAQQELYTPELKYTRDHLLGQRSNGALAQASVDWASHGQGDARHVTARLALLRLDRHLGVIDPAWRGDHARLGAFSFGDFEFLGEDFVHRPIGEQLRSGRAVPGYVAPGTVNGTPFGPAAEGLFVTEGGSGIANWSRTEFVGGDLVGEVLRADGSVLRGGASARFYQVQTYERVRSWLAGSSLNFARFHPATASGFGEYRLIVDRAFQVQFGLRVETFRSGIELEGGGGVLGSPAVDSGWKLSFMPRVGVAGLVPGTGERLSYRVSYSRVAQPPDFRFFLDTTIGDSLRTDIRRQGNPNLGFEEGRSYEAGLSWLLLPQLGVSVTAFRKDLLGLVTGSIRFADTGEGQYTTGDHGQVNGVEVSARGRWADVALRAGYALQKAVGVGTGVFGDSIMSADERVEYPLAFDRRHAVDAALLLGRSAGSEDARWAGALTATMHSGYPLDRTVEHSGVADRPTYLPWTTVLDLRGSRELGAPPGCASCSWRVTVDARNLLGRDNVIAYRRDNARVAPPAEYVDSVAALVSISEPIPRESERYSAHIDLDGDGLITPAEFSTARTAAALDRADPSLFFGEARQVRLGVEVAF